MNASSRILIVENDAVLVMDLENLLTRMGYQVVGLAATGSDAVNLAFTQKPDAILMDIRLRGEMNGIEAAAKIREQQNTPVIYLTAHTDEITLQKAKVTEAYAYLAKPVRERELRASLEMALYKHAAEQRLQHLNQVLRAVRNVNQLITREKDAQRLLDEACQILLRTRGYRFVWIGQFGGHVLAPRTFAGEGQSLIDHIRATVTPEQGVKLPGVEALRTRQTVICQDMLNDERYAPWVEAIEKTHFRSTIAIPMLYEQEVYGILIVYADQTNIFNEEEVSLLSELAGDIAFGLKSIAQDIEHKAAENALRRSEAKFRAVVENSNDGILFGDANAVISYRSPSYSRINGYSDEERVGHSGFETIHPDDTARIREYWQQVVQHPGLSIKAKYRIRHKDGTWRWLETTAQNLLNHPDVQEIVVASRDITERKLAEEEVKRLAQQKSLILNAAGEGIIGIDPDGNHVFVNLAAAAMLGYDPAELIGLNSHAIWHHTHADGTPYPPEACPSNIALQNGTPSRISDENFWRKDGTSFPVEYATTPIYEQEQITGAVITFVDITERKATEAKIAQSEKKYRELFRVNKDGISIFSVSAEQGPQRFVELNDAAHAILGYTKAEMLRLTPKTLEPEATHEQLRARQAELMTKGFTTFEAILAHKDGRRLYTEFTSQMIEYEGSPAVMNIVHDVTDRKQREREMESIAVLSEALRAASNRVEMLPVIAGQIVNLISADAVTIEIIEPLTGDVIVEVAEGVWKSLSGARQKPGTGINAIISQTRQPYHTHDLQNDPNLTYPEWARDGVRGAAGVPLSAQEKLIGFIWVGRKTDILEADVRFLAAIANFIANAIHRATLYEQTVKDAAELELAYNTTLAGWANALELRDYETKGHSLRVVERTVELARLMGVNEADLENIRRGALLHDIGKMGIPDAILLKKGKLDEKEWEIMRRHPQYAFNLLNQIKYLRSAIVIPYCHHEKWDGTGYPRGLKGQEIPFEARIFAIVDVWDALISDRTYRPAWSTERAMEYIRKQSGKQFDPAVVQAFLEICRMASKKRI